MAIDGSLVDPPFCPGEQMKHKARIKSRGLDGLVRRIREEIASSYYREGGSIPSTRALAEHYGVSSETVRRGLKQLEQEGILESKPRSGFRVASSKNSSLIQPVAFITDYRSDLSDAQPATRALSFAIQAAAASRDWSLLGAHGGGRKPEAVVEQIRGSNAWGVILDSIDDDLRDEVLQAGPPVVMVNSWVEDSAVDVVLQDNYRGGFLAADYLAAQGAKKIGWVGASAEFCHSRERFAGANAALLKHRLRIEDKRIISPSQGDMLDQVCKLLKSKDRPDALLVFSPKALAPVRDAAKKLGLALGKDLGIVGWIVEDCFDSDHRAIFEGGYVPPAIVWSVREMAERAVTLLIERSEGAGRRPVRACIATELRTSAKK